MNYGQNIYKTMCNYSRWSGLKMGEIERSLGKPKGWLSRLPKRDNITLNEILVLKSFVQLNKTTLDEFINKVYFEDRLLREERIKLEKQIEELQERIKEVDGKMLCSDEP